MKISTATQTTKLVIETWWCNDPKFTGHVRIWKTNSPHPLTGSRTLMKQWDVFSPHGLRHTLKVAARYRKALLRR